jgi:hypothetical protein
MARKSNTRTQRSKQELIRADAVGSLDDQNFRDAVDIQISVEARVPKGSKLKKEVIEEAIRYKAATGRNPKGMKIRIVRWRNPDASRERGIGPRWRGGKRSKERKEKDRNRWRTLRRALQAKEMVYKIAIARGNRRKKRRK